MKGGVQHLHWLYGRLDVQPLGGRNAIWQQSQRTEINWALVLYLKYYNFTGHW
jgi:hypothetical protein